MISNILYGGLVAFVLSLGLVFFHELGHMLTSYYYTKNKDIKLYYYPFKRKIGMYDMRYRNLNKSQKVKVILNGIILGAVYLLAIISIISNSLVSFAFLLFYLIGIRKDIARLWNLWRLDI